MAVRLCSLLVLWTLMTACGDRSRKEPIVPSQQPSTDDHKRKRLLGVDWLRSGTLVILRADEDSDEFLEVDVQTGLERTLRSVPVRSGLSVLRVRGDTLAAWAFQGTLNVFNMRSGAFLRSLQPVDSLEWVVSQGGVWIAAVSGGSGADAGLIRLLRGQQGSWEEHAAYPPQDWLFPTCAVRTSGTSSSILTIQLTVENSCLLRSYGLPGGQIREESSVRLPGSMDAVQGSEPWIPGLRLMSLSREKVFVLRPTSRTEGYIDEVTPEDGASGRRVPYTCPGQPWDIRVSPGAREILLVWIQGDALAFDVLQIQ